MSYSLDVNYIKNTVEHILERVHAPGPKRQVKVKHDRISFACPICGDSAKDKSQKRGHLFLNNLYFKCYNEDCRSTFTKMCKEFDVQIDPNKKLELINYIDTNFQRFKQEEDEFVTASLDKMIRMEDFQAWFDSGRGPLKGFGSVQFGSAVYMYLLERGIPRDLITEMFFEGLHVSADGRFKEPRVVFVNKLGDKVLGMQERNLKSGYKRKFKVWTFKEMYDRVYDTEMDDIEAIAYNKLSYLFNILNINFDSTITLFEGYIDSLFMPNSIGAVGMNTDYSFLINNDLDLRFFTDNDRPGKLKALEWLKKGFKVFLWEKLRDDLARKNGDVHAFKTWFDDPDDGVKDLNALMQKCPTHWKELDKYFTSDPFDSIYINPGPRKPNKIEEIHMNEISWDRLIKELKNIR